MTFLYFLLTILYFDATIKYNFDGKDRVMTEKNTLADDLATELRVEVNKKIVGVSIIVSIILFLINPFLIIIPLICWWFWAYAVNMEKKRIAENAKFQKELWSSDTGVKLSFDYGEGKERRTMLLHKIIEYEKEYREELRYYDKEIEELKDEIAKLDKYDDDSRQEKIDLKEAQKQRKECVKGRKNYLTEFYFSGIDQDKNDLRIFNLRNIYNFANENGKELSGEELAEHLGNKGLYKTFEEYGIF